MRGFNDLMKRIGAPASILADEDAMRKFRAHSIVVPVLPALLTADRNGTNCNPGEAVYLLHLLLSTNGSLNGHLSESYLESVRATKQIDSSHPASMFIALASGISDQTEHYSEKHHPRTTIKLMNGVFQTLGF